jgi:uncharacterized membrane protein YfhO
VEVLLYSPRSIELRVKASARALLVSSEAFYPGWEVLVDDERGELLRINTAFRGAVIPPGEHLVRFRFVPRSFHWGLVVTVVSLVGSLGSLFRASDRSSLSARKLVQS